MMPAEHNAIFFRKNLRSGCSMAFLRASGEPPTRCRLMRAPREFGVPNTCLRISPGPHPQRARVLALNGARRFVPEYRPFPAVRYVGHVAGDGGVIAECRICQHRLARLHGLEERVQVRTHVVPIVTAV